MIEFQYFDRLSGPQFGVLNSDSWSWTGTMGLGWDSGCLDWDLGSCIGFRVLDWVSVSWIDFKCLGFGFWDLDWDLGS